MTSLRSRELGVATVPHRERALGVANTRRSAAAALKTRLRDGAVSVQELLEEPPEALDEFMVWQVLLWAPGVGRSRVRALNVRAVREGHVNLAAPLGALTPRQRHWLACQLPAPRARWRTASSVRCGAAAGKEEG